MGGRPKPRPSADEPRPSNSAAVPPQPVLRDPRLIRRPAEASAPQGPKSTDLVPMEVTLPSGEVREVRAGGKRGPPSSDEEVTRDLKKPCQEDSSEESSTQEEGSIRSSGSSETITVPRELFEKLKASYMPEEKRSASFAEITATPSRPTSPRGDPHRKMAPTAPADANASAKANANANATASATGSAAKSHYPPIVVEKLPGWSQHLKELAEKLGHPPNVRPFGEGIRFLPKSPEEFRMVQRHMVEASEKDASIHWYCFSVPQELPTKVALRGLPTSAQEEEIKNALQEKGFEATHVRRIPSVRGRPGCVYHLQLARLSTEKLKELYGITNILNMPGVRFEGWRGPGGVAQCHRCQAFGHSSHNCHRPPRCVRCAGEHIVADCPRSRTELPSCANCGRAHAANNRHCKAYRKAARQRNIPVRPQPPQTREQQKAPKQPSRAERRARQRPEDEEQSPTLQTQAPAKMPEVQAKKSKRGGRQVQRRRQAASARALVIPTPVLPTPVLPKPQPAERQRTTEPTEDMDAESAVQTLLQTRPATLAPRSGTTRGHISSPDRKEPMTRQEGAMIVEMLKALFGYMRSISTWQDDQETADRVQDTFRAWDEQRPRQDPDVQET